MRMITLSWRILLIKQRRKKYTWFILLLIILFLYSLISTFLESKTKTTNTFTISTKKRQQQRHHDYYNDNDDVNSIELGDDPSLDSVLVSAVTLLKTTTTTSSYTSTANDKNGIKVSLITKRKYCNHVEHDCMFRAWISGPTKYGSYMRRVHAIEGDGDGDDDDGQELEFIKNTTNNKTTLLLSTDTTTAATTTTKESASLYVVEFGPIYESGIYNCLVVLETTHNTSKTIGGYGAPNFFSIGFNISRRNIINKGERITKAPLSTNSTFKIHVINGDHYNVDEKEGGGGKHNNNNDSIVVYHKSPKKDVDVASKEEEEEFSRKKDQLQLQQQQQHLPKCIYDTKHFGMNQFEWIKRSIIQQKYNLTSKHTLMIPDELLLLPTNNYDDTDTTSPNNNSNKTTTTKPYTTNWHNENYLQPYQDYVWHSRNCKQEWIDPSTIFNLPTKLNKKSLKMVFVGTSRLGYTTSLIQRMFELFFDKQQQQQEKNNTTTTSNTTTTTTAIINSSKKKLEITRVMFPQIDVYAKKTKENLEKLLSKHNVCLNNGKEGKKKNLTNFNEEDDQAIVFIISHGIWESLHYDIRHEDTKQWELDCIGADRKKILPKQMDKPFRFQHIAETVISTIINRCGGRRNQKGDDNDEDPPSLLFRIVIMTNPLTQSWDGRVDDDNDVQKYDVGHWAQPLLGVRLEVVNWAWLNVASKYNLTIVDGAGASAPRRDATFDNVHYNLEGEKIGNEVTVTFAQLIFAGILQSFGY